MKPMNKNKLNRITKIPKKIDNKEQFIKYKNDTRMTLQKKYIYTNIKLMKQLKSHLKLQIISMSSLSVLSQNYLQNYK